MYDSLSSLSLMPSGRYCVSGSYFTSCVCLFLCAYLSQILPFVALLAFRFSIYLCFLSVSSIFYFFPHTSGIYIFLPSVVSFIMHTLAKRALWTKLIGYNAASKYGLLHFSILRICRNDPVTPFVILVDLFWVIAWPEISFEICTSRYRLHKFFDGK